MHRQPIPRCSLPAICALIALSGAGAARAQTPLPRQTDRYDFSAVTARLQEMQPSVGNFGLILVKDGVVVYEKGFGNFRLDAVMPIASASKMPTATAVMTLVDAGKIKLDEPVSKYLPDWPADKAKITVRQTLSCMTGMNSFAPLRLTGSMTEVMDRIARQPMRAEPGTAFIYGGNGFQTAARIAEVVSGKSWSAFFADAIAKPLGMSTFNYGRFPTPWVAGTGNCSLDDYARLLILHLDGGTFNGKRVLSEASVREMQKDQVGKARILASPAPDGWHYGMGWWLTPPAEAGQPVTEISDQGAFGATPWIDLKRHYGGFLLIRSNVPTANRLWNAIRPLINERIDGTAGKKTSVVARPVTSSRKDPRAT